MYMYAVQISTSTSSLRMWKTEQKAEKLLPRRKTTVERATNVPERRQTGIAERLTLHVCRQPSADTLAPNLPNPFNLELPQRSAAVVATK